MPKYHVFWSKTYHVSGEYVMEADSPAEADQKARDSIGDQTGTSQYDPDGDYVEVMEVDEHTTLGVH